MALSKIFKIKNASIVFILILTSSCIDDTNRLEENVTGNDNGNLTQSAIISAFNGNIDLNNLENYENQTIPNYIDDDNTENNPITDEGATLGRVLFYDKSLSTNNQIACASCHLQAFAFGDINQTSTGVNGETGRHSMRLVNARFGNEENFFWDERANSLENQTTQPIEDHIEMGFSGQNGAPDFNDLINKLEQIDYYQELFTFVYGNANITEQRIQNSLAQFIRSIQSFDSKYDEGRSQVNNNNANFPNFSALENQGKQLFMQNSDLNNNGVRTGGGLDCNGCHQAPEFDIRGNSDNNGVVHTIAGDALDFDIVRSPTLRNSLRANGNLNGPMMHTGDFETMDEVIDHYNNINANGNPNLDNRLQENGNGQQLNITQNERTALLAFLQTLDGVDVYTNPKWSDPFN